MPCVFACDKCGKIILVEINRDGQIEKGRVFAIMTKEYMAVIPDNIILCKKCYNKFNKERGELIRKWIKGE